CRATSKRGRATKSKTSSECCWNRSPTNGPPFGRFVSTHSFPSFSANWTTSTSRRPPPNITSTEVYWKGRRFTKTKAIKTNKSSSSWVIKDRTRRTTVKVGTPNLFYYLRYEERCIASSQN